MSNWIRVTKQSKCPICKKPDWCSISDDGKYAWCERIPSNENNPKIHRLTNEIIPAMLPNKRPIRPKIKHDEWVRIIKTECRITITELCKLSHDLNISPRSLRRMVVGYHGKMKCWTFPMLNGHGRYIGIRTRFADNKRSYPGSSNGLFIPFNINGTDELVIVEGPTDTAALLDLDIYAIGRASCNSCVNYVKDYVSRTKPKNIIIVADNDKPKLRPDGKKYYPGQDGAIALAKALPYKELYIKIIKPIGCKDVREWKRKGLTKELFYQVVKNTRRFI